MPTILLLAASPLNLDRLRLGNELKKIKQALERSRNREKWKIESIDATTVDDLRRALLDFTPTIVHFSGHGGGESGLAFENDDGETHEATTIALTKLFHHFKESLKCVVLNACYTDVQCAKIREQIDHVIGMNGSIDDESATKFAVAFYDSIFAGTTFRQAFDLGCTAIDLAKLPDHDVPVFLTSPSVGEESLSYSSLVPQFEDLIHSYINAPFANRWKFAYDGVAKREIMEKYYGENLHATIDKVVVFAARQIDEKHWKVRAKLSAKGEKASQEFYFRVVDRDLKIDREATVGYWTTAPGVFLAYGTSEPIIARVVAKLGTRYFGIYSDRQRMFQAVSLDTQSNHSFYGYVHRNSSDGSEILKILSDGNKHEIIVEIGNEDDETDQVQIYRMVSRSWIMPEPSS